MVFGVEAGREVGRRGWLGIRFAEEQRFKFGVKELWTDSKRWGFVEFVGWVGYLSQCWLEFVPKRRGSYSIRDLRSPRRRFTWLHGEENLWIQISCLERKRWIINIVQLKSLLVKKRDSRIWLTQTLNSKIIYCNRKYKISLQLIRWTTTRSCATGVKEKLIAYIIPDP